MDTNLKHRFWGEISLDPVFHEEPPLVKVILAGDELFHGLLESRKTLEFDRWLVPGVYDLTVEFLNKKDTDTVPDRNLDKAVIVESISVAGLRSQKFVWQGIYAPEYPEPWHSQQTPRPPAELLGHTYLSWNGIWTLKLSSPIFTWVHQVEDLGWIYD